MCLHMLCVVLQISPFKRTLPITLRDFRVWIPRSGPMGEPCGTEANQVHTLNLNLAHFSDEAAVHAFAQFAFAEEFCIKISAEHVDLLCQCIGWILRIVIQLAYLLSACTRW